MLDLRTGILSRVVEWLSPSEQVIRLRTHRLVSLTQRSIMAISWEVEAVGDPARVVVQSELVANEYVPPQSNDPRVAALLERPLEPLEHGGEGTRAWLLHQTKSSKLRMAAAMDHIIEAPDGHADRTRRERGQRTADGRLPAGEGPAAGADQVRQLRLVEPALAARTE